MESFSTLKHDLVLVAGQPLDVAARTALSDARALFSSSSFESWKKTQEASFGLLKAVNDRLDVVIKALNNVAKARR